MGRLTELAMPSDVVLLGFVGIVCLVLVVAFCIGAYEPWIEKESRKDAEKRLLNNIRND